jgi:hypothetical protein
VSNFTILRKIENGELIQLGTRSTREEAEEFIKDVQQFWPADYFVQANDRKLDTGNQRGNRLCHDGY